jgi:hypothetical protein
MIIVRNNSGIGNKIKNIVTALRLGHKDHDYVKLDFRYSDFFKLSQTVGFEDAKPEEKIISTWSLELFQDELDGHFLKTYNPLNIFHDETYSFELKNSIDFQFNNIESDLVIKFLTFFDRIKFHDSILKSLDETLGKINLVEMVGVHVRSWEDIPSRRNKLHDLGRYIKLMQQHKGNFFVATDSDAVEEQLNYVFPGRIVYSIEK